MIRIQVEHETLYNYQTEVELAHHLAYLKPRVSTWQRVLQSELSVFPAPDTQSETYDSFGNCRTFFTLAAPHTTLSVRALSVVQLTDRYAEINLAATPSWEIVREALAYALDRPYLAASEFTFASPYIPRLDALRHYAQPSFTRHRPIGLACAELNERINRDFKYAPQATDIYTPLSEAFEKRAGVCQDFSHILIGCLRALGLSAQYVSGYLLTKPAPGKAKLRGADASHAWASVYCPGVAGDWLELDPTNKLIVSTEHVRVAQGRDFGDVSPLRGVIRGGGDHSLRIAVTSEALNF
jgi:transglutaminase-like putative cysteine protease